MFESLDNFRYLWDTVDILLIAVIVYYFLKMIEGTRAAQVLFGLFILFILYHFSQRGLFTLNWLLGHFLGSFILIIVILFQNDIRKTLAALGRRPFLLRFSKPKITETYIDEIVKASSYMSSKKIGCLIAIERENSLNDYVEIGMKLDSLVSIELIISIFNPSSPLHDGAIVIGNNRILSAGSFFPLLTDPDLELDLGSRHRAALGITSETDTVVIIVSEETGIMSLSYNGEIIRGLDSASLRSNLIELLGLERKEVGFNSYLGNLFNKLNSVKK